MRAFNCLNRRISFSIHVLGIKHSRSVWCFHVNQTSARLFFMHKINISNATKKHGKRSVKTKKQRRKKAKTTKTSLEIFLSLLHSEKRFRMQFMLRSSPTWFLQVY